MQGRPRLLAQKLADRALIGSADNSTQESAMTINAQFQDDKELIESLCPNELDSFEKWFAELNAENSKRDNMFYSGQNLEESTGVKCWFDFFVHGLTPAEALDADLANA